MSNEPLVTVVIIFFQAERFLAEAIESVLAQTYVRLEVILVDDGSTDGSAALADGYAATDARVRVVSHPGRENRGMSASRNLGVSHGSGELVAFLDADDVWLPEKLEQQIAILRRFPDVGMVYGRTLWWYGWTGDPVDAARDYLIAPDVELDRAFLPGELFARFLADGSVPPYTCSVLLRRSMFDRLGGFEDSFRSLYEDQVFFAKVLLHESVYVADTCWDRYRQHADSACAHALRAGNLHPVDPREPRRVFLEWLAAYVRRTLPSSPLAQRAVEKELRPYDFPAAPLDVDAVTRATGLTGLIDAHLDVPTVAAEIGKETLDLIGWALGRHEPVAAIEVIAGERLVASAPVTAHRQDIAAAFPDVAWAGACGFWAHMVPIGLGAWELDVLAVLGDGSRERFATVAVCRRPRPKDVEIGAPLVSVVFGMDDPDALAAALDDVAAQDYPRIEAIVTGRPELPAGTVGARVVDVGDVAASEARCRALAAAAGSLIMFLDGGESPAADEIAAGVSALAGAPSASSWSRDDTRAPAVMFRRAALDRTASRRCGVGPPDLALLYHRVARPASDRWNLAVDPERFEEQLRVIAGKAVGVALPEIVTSGGPAADGRPRVAITFDDGYRDNVSIALPLLERYGLPATVFLTSGAIGSPHEFWWDELERLAAGLDASACELGDVFQRFPRSVSPMQGSLYDALYAMLRPLAADEREEALEQLRTAIDLQAPQTDDLPIGAAELDLLAASPLVEIGAHTVSHPQLSALAPRVQRAEIVRGKRELENVLGRPVRGFAYPHGGPLDYEPVTRALVEDAGFEYACVAHQEVALPADRFEIPRFVVGDWDGDEFERRLSGWLTR